MKDIYEQLADFVDHLPAGYPQTESGVDLRILRKLFTQEDAELFMHLTLLEEEPKVIARRAKQPVEIISKRLDEMEKKGLIMGVHWPGKPTQYLAYNFVVGFWEGQVNRLDRELVEDFEEYLNTLFDNELWRKAPQMRTIPVRESIPIQAEAMPYEIAEKVIESNSTFAITKCICRQEFHILGKGCGKPLETCMSFGTVAEHIIDSGRGRRISREEMLAVLKQADTAGLVLQPANSKKPVFICACCGDCCAVLRRIKLHPKPSSLVSSPYQTAHDDDLCSGCGTCVDRCQMEAITIPNGVAVVDLDRCIGCGLCVSTCVTGALTLVRKPDSEQHSIPESITATNIQLAQARGLYSNTELVTLLVKSKIDRLAARF
jgi:ferredoxin